MNHVEIDGSFEVTPEGDTHYTLTARGQGGVETYEVELVLESLPEGLQGPFSGWIVAEVAHPLVFDIEIPFSGVLSPQQSGAPAPPRLGGG